MIRAGWKVDATLGCNNFTNINIRRLLAFQSFPALQRGVTSRYTGSGGLLEGIFV